MCGSYFCDEHQPVSNEDPNAISIVLVGKLGYGKSATGNSILGRKAFKSRASSKEVTGTSELQSTVLSDGHNHRTVNVIDTPGLFDLSTEPKDMGKEIVKCMNLARDGIHAILVVFSIRAWFSEEEETIIQRLQMFFGDRIVDYMVVVEEDDMCFDDYLNDSKPLQSIIQTCENRVLLFNNKAKGEIEKTLQVRQLLNCVDSVMAAHGGESFSHEIFLEFKVEERLTNMIDKLTKDLEKEQDARCKSDEEIQKLEELCKGSCSFGWLYFSLCDVMWRKILAIMTCGDGDCYFVLLCVPL